jgi:hypothetical protein
VTKRIEGGRAGEAERQHPALAAMGALRGELRPLSAGKDASRLDHEGLACLRQFRAVRHAVKQLGAELLFQIPDLLADRRLADAKLLCRPRKIPLLCLRKKITDMA